MYRLRPLPPSKRITEVEEVKDSLPWEKPSLHLYVSAEREMSKEDLIAHRNILSDPDFLSIEKGIIIRIGERMDTALAEETDEMERKANIVCINELKDILLEWQNIRADAEKGEEVDEPENEDGKKKPVIKLL